MLIKSKLEETYMIQVKECNHILKKELKWF